MQARGDHAAALAGTQALLGGDPHHRELLLIAARAQRHLRQTDAALDTLARLADIAPQFSQMHLERGLCHVARQDAALAIAALGEAAALNPALPMAWKMLEGLWRMTGDTANAAIAAQHGVQLRALPAAVVTATSLFCDGDLGPAEAITREFLLAHGDHPEAMRLLARIGAAHDVLDDADILYAGVLALVPDHHAARCEYVDTLIRRHKFAAAREILAPLLAREPADTPARLQAATVAMGLGDFNAAIELYRAMIAETDADQAPAARQRAADLQLWLGHALKNLGRLPEAIAAYRAGAALRPDFGDAWWSLANLKTFRFDAADQAAMAAAADDDTTANDDRVHLAFALGKAHEDSGDAATAWRCYAEGNARQRAASAHRAEIFETNTRLQKTVCTPAFFAARAGWGEPARDPIFILGLPRAGSTLIEQILASHPLIEGTHELPDIHRIALDLHGRDREEDNPRYPGTMAELTEPQARELGERYLAETRVHRALQRPLFIDKMPNNFRHIGLIHLILPNATIIDARREPMACCFSNFKQLFAQGQEFTYSIEDIARYYRTYLELMRHWDAALPGKILRMINDDVIDDLDSQVRRLLTHCGLDFEPACLDFHRTERAVRTPSSEQVRRPVNRDGVDQWRKFEPWLGPLKDALGDAVEGWRA